ncbi:MAG: hypothetical protein U1E65_30060 [Myxococcota bacterium]
MGRYPLLALWVALLGCDSGGQCRAPERSRFGLSAECMKEDGVPRAGTLVRTASATEGTEFLFRAPGTGDVRVVLSLATPLPGAGPWNARLTCGNISLLRQAILILPDSAGRVGLAAWSVFDLPLPPNTSFGVEYVDTGCSLSSDCGPFYPKDLVATSTGGVTVRVGMEREETIPGLGTFGNGGSGALVNSQECTDVVNGVEGYFLREGFSR